MKYYLIIDGGTTNLRVMLVDECGALLGTQKRSVGAAAAAVAGSNQALREATHTCIKEVLSAASLSMQDVSDCFAFGMITSASGLKEIPHLCAPAKVEDFRMSMASVLFEDIAPFPIRFIPGLKNFSGTVTLENLAQMDMMRGEETEAIGFLQLAKPESSCVLVLPGTHNKFIVISEDGAILRCMTTMSGEMLSVLTHHTILTESVGGCFVEAAQYDRGMMLAGAAACSAGIGRAAFSTRILRTLGDMPQEKIASFLLGVALKSDADALMTLLRDVPNAKIYIAGKEPLRTALVDLFEHERMIVESVCAEIASRVGIAGALAVAGVI